MQNEDREMLTAERIDRTPGFDSVRAGLRIGTIGAAGRGRPSYLTSSEAYDKQPTMTLQEAIEVLKHTEADIYGRIAIRKAIDALLTMEVEE